MIFTEVQLRLKSYLQSRAIVSRIKIVLSLYKLTQKLNCGDVEHGQAERNDYNACFVQGWLEISFLNIVML